MCLFLIHNSSILGFILLGAILNPIPTFDKELQDLFLMSVRAKISVLQFRTTVDTINKLCYIRIIVLL